jgi:type II secretory pathway pseudopilin PulG
MVKPANTGFALVVTLMLLVLLGILALGLLSLSSVALRSSAEQSARAEARRNARLAAMLALGELQRLAGQDTRVTASTRLFSDSNLDATGVWRSWEGSDRDSAGKPQAPDYPAKERKGDPEPPYVGAGEGRFLGWLASPLSGADFDPSDLPGLFAQQEPGTVPLVGLGSALAERQIHAMPTIVDVGGRKGGYAWWVSGQNSKAAVRRGRVEEPTSVAGWQERMKSHGKPDAEVFGLGKLKKMPVTTVISSRKTFELIHDRSMNKTFHDLTNYSVGLLTNTAAGGWRRDLSLLSENYESLPATNLPSFTIRPGQIQTFSKAQVGTSPTTHPPNPLLYHWAKYRTGANRSAWQQTPPICSWSALADYMLQYRKLSTTSASRTAMPFFARGLGGGGGRFYFQDQVRRAPVIARVQWIFSLCSRQQTDPNNPANTHQAGLLITPVVTLWNPYSVEISTTRYSISIKGPFAPISFRFRVGNQTFPDTALHAIVKNGRFNINITSPFTLAPGASRIFGLSENVPKESSSAGNIELTPGYRPNGGFLFYGINNGTEVYGTSSDQFSVEEFAYGGLASDDGSSGLGIYVDVKPNNNFLAHRMVYKKPEIGGDTVIDMLYPPVTNAISSTLGGVEGIRNKPFAGAIWGFRPATPRPLDPKFNNLHTKGMLVSSPLSYYTELGAGDGDRNAHVTMVESGTYHPINSPYDYTFQDVNGWNDTQNIPQFEPDTDSGYIVSGLTAGDGLTRCVMAELPTRPLQSLPELQHFDARNNNPLPPFHFNLIGNSSACPIPAPDELYVKILSAKNNGLSNDDSYLLNHLLFDDWFISSVAPSLKDFSGTAERSISEVYADHLSGAKALPNRFYDPAQGADPDFDVGLGTRSPKTNKYNYETIASQLEVKGMININSVSVEAWKSWLKHGREVHVPYLTGDGATALDSQKSYAFPRTTIAGDKDAGSGSGSSNPLFPDASEFAGYRTLTESQVDALAEEIVAEIRERGPFLSLSEFVNRRVTSDKRLAVAGVIQQALDTLSESGSSAKNPFRVLQQNSFKITTAAPGATAHKFPEAALGYTAFGVPGWVRQADILRPLAPVLSARDDTFLIRAYGDARDKQDPSKVLAQAWCEIVVRRNTQYVDPTDAPTVDPHSSEMVSEMNKRFGRRFEIVSFRWLNRREI